RAASRAAGEAVHVVTGPCGGCHPLMLPSATNFLSPCLCDSAAFLRGAGNIGSLSGSIQDFTMVRRAPSEVKVIYRTRLIGMTDKNYRPTLAGLRAFLAGLSAFVAVAESAISAAQQAFSG
ncbi:MAG: hypothetical protein QOJ61_2626, partial [Mycobacterium sp.]|nr:hypothetical protein [Mycobacterium sp.]